MKTLCLLLAACLPLFVAAQELRTFMLNGRYGFTKNDREVIPATFEYAANFSSGRAAVMINKKWGYIDTKGHLVIPATLEHVESFRNGFALYYEGNKAGLLDSMGNKVVPAVCDEIYENRDYYSLRKDNKYGSYIPKTGVYIEPKYGNYYVSNRFIVAKNGNFFDVFTEAGKLIGHNVIQSPKLIGHYNTATCDLVWQDSVRIVDTVGNPITKNYQHISEYNCQVRRMNLDEGYYNYYYHIYLLHLPSEEKIYDEYGNEGPSNAFHLYFEDGRLFDDAVYSDFSNANDEYTVKRNGVWCRISNEGDLIPSKYIGKQMFNNYSLFYLPDSTVDVSRVLTNYQEYDPYTYSENAFMSDTTIIAHFHRVIVLMNETYEPIYDPDYYEMETPVAVPIIFDVLEVEGDGENAGKYALYDLTKKMYIAPFDNQLKGLEDVEYMKRTYAIFRNEERMIAFSIDGKSSPYEYVTYDKIYGMGYVLTDSLGKTTFVSFTADTVLQIPPGINVFNSASIFTNELYSLDPETGESIYTEGIREFNREFLVLTNKEEPQQFGFIDYQSNLILPRYDSIFSTNSFSYRTYEMYPVIATRKNKKYGAYDLKEGLELKPAFDSILTLHYDHEFGMLYTQPDRQPYYLNMRGRKFKTLSYDVEVFTQNKKKGFRNGSDFAENDFFNDTVVPAVYRDLNVLNDIPFCIATNFNGKSGVINMIGDTVLPFSYDELKWEEDFSFPEESGYGWFRTRVGKKYGIVNIKLKTEIESEFDEIIWAGESFQIGQDGEGSPSFWETINTLVVVKDDKCGLYSDRGTVLIPYGTDGIDLQSIGQTLMMNVQKGDKVGSFYYNPFSPPEVDLPDRWYDFVVEGYGYRKIENGYGKYEIVSAIYMGDVESFEVDPEVCSFEVFEEDGLLGLRDIETKKVVMKPQLRYVHFIDSDTVVKFVDGITYYGSIYKKKNMYAISEW